MKKSFTLLEVVISITLFMILVLFLYKSLDQVKHTNKIFEDKKEAFEKTNRVNKIFLEDIAEAQKEIDTKNLDKNKNSIVLFETNNSFHNPYYKNVAYLILNKSELIRMESKTKFQIDFKKQRLKDEFYDNLYIDTLLKDVESFNAKLSKDKKQIVFIIKQKDYKDFKIYKAFQLGDSSDD